ncbi:MAG: GspH/FimT family pseudopilin [Gammaproteobacteria bacterium]|nr:GspH/FimT family pseudopilin [Gammaproteobacteria bacterium]
MRRQSGITLVELLVTLAVIGIMVGVVFPGFRGLMDRNSMTTTANSLVLAVSYARSEALRGAGLVRLRARGTWPGGWEVVVPDENGVNQVVRVFDPIPGSLTLAASGGITQLTFNNQGLLQDATPRTFTLCLPGDSGVEISISATGRPNTSPLNAAACPAGS